MGNQRAIAVLRTFFAEQGPFVDELRAAGADLRFGPDPGSDEAALIERCRGAWAALGIGPFTRRVFAALPELRYIQGTIIGYDLIDIAAATEHGVVVANNPAFCREEVSDHAAMLILAAARRLPNQIHRLDEVGWEMAAGIAAMGATPRLRGSTLGFIGFGAIARLTAEKLRGFGMHYLAYDPYATPALFDQHGVRAVTLDELFEQADILSMHALLSDETRGMVREEHFRRMKRTAWLVNTSRGATIHEPALFKALQEGWIGGACLDVVEVEPPVATNPLLTLPNVILTPHTANFSDAARIDQVRQATDEVLRVLGGAWPLNLVNPAVKAHGGPWSSPVRP